MAHKKTTPVRSQMGSVMPHMEGLTHVGRYPVVTSLDLGQKKATPTPGQTAGNATRPSRAGTKPFSYGKNST